MVLSTTVRSWAILVIQLILLANFTVQLSAYLFAPSPSEFQRFGTVLIASGVLFMALHGPTLIDWQIARRAGDKEAEKVRPYETAATFIVNIVFIGGGTLITGYGDRFVCLINQGGFQACSF